MNINARLEDFHICVDGMADLEHTIKDGKCVDSALNAIVCARRLQALAYEVARELKPSEIEEYVRRS